MVLVTCESVNGVAQHHVGTPLVLATGLLERPTLGDWFPHQPSRLQVVDLKNRLLRWRTEPALDTLLHSGHQNAIAEPLPTFF